MEGNMKRFAKTILIALAVIASLVLVQPANAWDGHGGYYRHGGYHGYYHGGWGWGWGPRVYVGVPAPYYWYPPYYTYSPSYYYRPYPYYMYPYYPYYGGTADGNSEPGFPYYYEPAH